jgi:hypothetical protein
MPTVSNSHHPECFRHAEHRPRSDGKIRLDQEAFDIWFIFRLAFLDRPDVRLRTQEGQRPELIQVVLSEWYWEPELPPLLRGDLDAEEFYFHSNHETVVTHHDPHWVDRLYGAEPKHVPPAPSPTIHFPRQRTGAVQLSRRAPRPQQQDSAERFRHAYNHKVGLEPHQYVVRIAGETVMLSECWVCGEPMP